MPGGTQRHTTRRRTSFLSFFPKMLRGDRVVESPQKALVTAQPSVGLFFLVFRPHSPSETHFNFLRFYSMRRRNANLSAVTLRLRARRPRLPVRLFARVLPCEILIRIHNTELLESIPLEVAPSFFQKKRRKL